MKIKTGGAMKITLPLSLHCGCRLFEDGLNWTFDRCPLHAAAPELLAACRGIVNDWNGNLSNAVAAVQAAIRAAEPPSEAQSQGRE